MYGINLTNKNVRKFSGELYLNNSVSVEELSADSYPAEIRCSSNKCLPEKRSLECKYASFKNIQISRGSYQTDISEA